jgi:hypothetical protein
MVLSPFMINVVSIVTGVFTYDSTNVKVRFVWYLGFVHSLVVAAMKALFNRTHLVVLLG